ncbi:MAG: hypothetical protein A2Y76_12925 [Planctomycetes bacterium RBG_13_60_9]|nr:MAG: hypothetical protein A2Y76_12925 [Planctomycetes bacterium RBG_13_60_9]
MSLCQIATSGKQVIRRASRAAIQKYFTTRPDSQRGMTWLSKTNRYRKFCISRYAADTKANPSTTQEKDLLAYVGSSAPCHAIDGWSFLARAVDSVMKGDTYSAIHFGYYAELRAAMSLLGAEGIGIFDNKHSVIDPAGKVSPFPRKGHGDVTGKSSTGTHAAVWPILQHWASLVRAVDLIDDLIAPSGIALSSWLSVAGNVHSMRALAKKWFSSWGLDLEVFDADHDRRNMVSYRPSEFRKAYPDATSATRFLEDLWSLFEPGATNRFPVLENLLFRRAWNQLRCGKPQEQRLSQLGLTSDEVAKWAHFLQSSDYPLPLELAEQQSAVEDPMCHLQVVSRAALLLFVATASARSLLTEASFTSDTLAFWWKQHGEQRAIWGSHQTPDDIFSIWADIDNRRQTSANWRSARGRLATPSLYDWRRDNPGIMDDLGSLELIGIWGLIP